MQFKEGECVYVRSGSPMMTVIEYKDGMVICFWVEKGKLRREAFPEAALARPQRHAISVGYRGVT